MRDTVEQEYRSTLKCIEIPQKNEGVSGKREEEGWGAAGRGRGDWVIDIVL